MNYLYTAVFTPLADGSGFEARVPDLPGCVSSGCDLPDAIAQITDAASVWLVTAEDECIPSHPATPQAAIERAADTLCSLIQVDSIAYRALTDTRAVRKNVSLPAWMANMADKRGINCSQVLQEGLRARLQSP